jgi:uncharacterized protein YdcH (DUF465 family)
MHVEHHPLIKEFPELRDRIHTLKANDHHFAKLADQYEEVDKHICRAEDAAEGHVEDHMHKLKAERLRLKDEVYKALQAA